MDAAPSTGAVKIALRPFKVGGRVFEPGDRYDPTTSGLTERENIVLERNRFYGDFSPQRYRNFIAARPPGTIGYGFTLEFLYQAGALERPAAEEKPAAVEIVPDDVTYLGYVFKIRKNGRFELVSVYSPEGGLMEAKSFRSQGKARAYVDTLPAANVLIAGEDDYKARMLELESLMDAKADTPRGLRLSVLAAAMEAYENGKASTDSGGSANQGGEAPLESGNDGDVQS